MSPLTLAANTLTAGTPHTTRAKPEAVRYAIGIARLAGQRSRTKKKATEIIGSSESAARTVGLIILFFYLIERLVK
jgi:hypothetical protein